MNLIESLDPLAFAEYLQQYRNTICGRHPIAVLLNVSFLYGLQKKRQQQSEIISSIIIGHSSSSYRR